MLWRKVSRLGMGSFWTKWFSIDSECLCCFSSDAHKLRSGGQGMGSLLGDEEQSQIKSRDDPSEPRGV